MPSKLLSSPEPTTAELTAPDCRIYERQACALPTTCQPASAQEMKELRWNATISDISLGGVRITLQRRFEKGAGLAIELPGSERRESSVVFVKVVHVKLQEDGSWALGCKFVSELSEDELQNLLFSTNHVLSSSPQECFEETGQDEPEDTSFSCEPPLPSADSSMELLPKTIESIEQRRHPRFLDIDNGILRLRLAVRPEFRGRRALLVDVSAGGIGFLLEHALEAGTVLAFELHDRGGMEMIARTARVRHSRPHPVPHEAPWLPQGTGFSKIFRRLLRVPPPPPQGEAWLVGCEFDQPIDANEIQQLLAQLKAPREEDPLQE